METTEHNVQDLSGLLRTTSERILRNTTSQPFRLPLTAEEVAGILRDSYRAQVVGRRRLYGGDEDTEAKVAKVSEWLTSGGLKPMLMLQGTAGNGKTTMLNAMAAMLFSLKRTIFETDTAIKNGSLSFSPDDLAVFMGLARVLTCRSIIHVSATEMVRRITQDPNRSEGYSQCGFLLLDDWGREAVTAKHFGSDLFPVVDVLYRRYDSLLPTVITTNMTNDDISRTYGERVADRLREVTDIVAYTGKSFRQ